MKGLRLTHLTFFGITRPTASIEFGATLTTITGPSNTGKSFVVDAIDFMFGAKELRENPYSAGYTDILLGLILPTGQPITVSRSINGGRFFLYESDVRDGPLDLPDRTLSPTHNPNSTNSLSRYLLQHIGLDGMRLRKNVHNQTVSLSFRNLAHLCIVREGQIQSEVPPVWTGPFVTRTSETSLLRLLLDGGDDSGLAESTPTKEKRTVATAKNEVIDAMLLDLELQLLEVSEPEELRDQLARLQRSFDQAVETADEFSADFDRLVTRRTSLRRMQSSADEKVGELSALGGRFGLLLDQYETDLARLEMVDEVGNVLGYFDRGDCPFCGTPHDAQPSLINDSERSTDFAVAARAEVKKTALLKADLIAVIADVNDQRDFQQHESARIGEELGRVRESLSKMGEARSDRTELEQILAQRLRVERQLNLYSQVDELERLRISVAEEASSESAAATSLMSLASIRAFSEEIRERLLEWGFNNAATARYDRSTQDIQTDDQFRASQGKGVRAILHAAFTTALVNYCHTNDRNYPGFLVMDSPLVTYKEPDGEDPLDNGIVELFYRDLAEGVQGQVIVVENMPPPDGIEGIHSITFTKKANVGRAGFLPPVSESRASVDA